MANYANVKNGVRCAVVMGVFAALCAAPLATAAPGGVSEAEQARINRFNDSRPRLQFEPTIRLDVSEINRAVAQTPGSWYVERNIERVIHQMDLPTTTPGSDTYLACAGSGNLEERGPGGPDERFDCFRIDRASAAQPQILLPDDWFCISAVHDSDGNIVTAGGTSSYPDRNGGYWGGSKQSYRYERASGDLVRLEDMDVERWYPNNAKDQNNNIYVYGGQSDGKQQSLWEVMADGGSTWKPVPGLTTKMASYADLQLIAKDTFAYTGALGGVAPIRPFMLNMKSNKQTSISGLRDPDKRKGASALLTYPAQDETVMVLGGAGAGRTVTTDAVDMIDYSGWPGSVPSFVPRAPLPEPMTTVLAVNLPNGQMFATGGSRVWRSGDVLWAGFYDPTANDWTMVAPPTVGRDYHGSIRTNLDGSVSVFGGNPSKYVFRSQVETYEPWYMDVPRPSIAAGTLSRQMAKGSAYVVKSSMPAGTDIGYYTLDAARASTHASSDPEQAMFELPFVKTGPGRARVTIPNNAMLTPGWYKLTVVTNTDVPSESLWVKVV